MRDGRRRRRLIPFTRHPSSPASSSIVARISNLSLLLFAAIIIILASLTARLRPIQLLRLSSLHLRPTPSPLAPAHRPLITMPRSRGDPYSYLYERMLPFHANFRRTIAMIQHTLPQTQTLPKRDLERFLAMGVQLVHHLEMHHSIEEAHIFPVLATKMPDFGASATHVHEHEVMHAALEAFGGELMATHRRLTGSQGKKAEAEGCGQALQREEEEGRKAWPRSVYDGEKVANLTQTLAEALLPHLEAEEASISAKSMRAAGWTEEEVLRIPI
ncbi:hypothetical protein BDZ90DRAFT_230694 [Jaminaea rosea]|uniref:Hemerythrin-like domain-containing protein n=1 Tax=Jaminaea rosea TaxID=1569628 RepID=A0A316UXY6_9BASI|nr:hypothetical protein BDZ90DRAFT_230694 [Jaminaea rosea]PWN29854.1 hypothetical protein BDZ90DRAFT_230694 [Jaminaea rosea]